MTEAGVATSAAQTNRGTIFVEDAVVTGVRAFAGQQYVQRIKAPRCARDAVAGSFVHVQCDAAIPMRRPLSIMRVNADDGWIELLFKVVGEGLRALANKQPGDAISIIGPIGNGFEPHSERPRLLMIGGGVGIPPLIFLAEQVHRDKSDWLPVVLMGSELPFPFDMNRSTLPVDCLPDGVDRSMPLLEKRNIPARLASLSGFPGCFDGLVTDLARLYLEAQSTEQQAQTEIFSCGPTPMLQAVAGLARDFDLPCQVSLEEYMACGVGGCAGCTVLLQTDRGPAMRRVCVDGPVFPANLVYPPQ